MPGIEGGLTMAVLAREPREAVGLWQPSATPRFKGFACPDASFCGLPVFH